MFMDEAPPDGSSAVLSVAAAASFSVAFPANSVGDTVFNSVVDFTASATATSDFQRLYSRAKRLYSIGQSVGRSVRLGHISAAFRHF